MQTFSGNSFSKLSGTRICVPHKSTLMQFRCRFYNASVAAAVVNVVCSVFAIFSVVTDLLFLLIIVVSLFWILSLLLLFTCRERPFEKFFKENFFCLVFVWGCCKGSLCVCVFFFGGGRGGKQKSSEQEARL